jgi:hypothetical protein
MNLISRIDLVMGEHKHMAERVNRTGWLLDEAARTRKSAANRTARAGHRWLLLVVLLVALLAALGAAEAVSAGPITVPSGPAGGGWRR